MNMVEGTGLDKLCYVVSDQDDLRAVLDKLMLTPFGNEQIRERKKALQDHTNRAGAEKILRLLS
jgi:hypothetical protein